MQEWVTVRITRGAGALPPSALADIVQRHARVSRTTAEAMASRLADGGDVTLDVPDAGLADRLRAELAGLGLEAR